LLAYTPVSYRVAQFVALQKPFLVDFNEPIAVRGECQDRPFDAMV
jgi:hypothetical protein